MVLVSFSPSVEYDKKKSSASRFRDKDVCYFPKAFLTLPHNEALVWVYESLGLISLNV